MRGRREAGLGSLSALLAEEQLDAALKRGGVKKLKTRKVLAAALAEARGERDNGATLAEVAAWWREVRPELVRLREREREAVRAARLEDGSLLLSPDSPWTEWCRTKRTFSVGCIYQKRTPEGMILVAGLAGSVWRTGGTHRSRRRWRCRQRG